MKERLWIAKKKKKTFLSISHWKWTRIGKVFLCDNNEGNDENDDAIKRINDQSKKHNIDIFFWKE